MRRAGTSSVRCSVRAIALAFVLTLGSGCHLVFGGTSYQERIEDASAGPADAAVDARVLDGARDDAALVDQLEIDARVNDAQVEDSSTHDASGNDGSDASAEDAHARDGEASDLAAPDMAAPDTAAPDTAAPDSAAPDTAAADAAGTDAGPEDVAEPDVCEPDCEGLCDGASDGCGGSCDGACRFGHWCSVQTCLPCSNDGACGPLCQNCTLNSTNRACVVDACGCTVDGPPHCAADESCVNSTCAAIDDECALGTHACDPCAGICTDTVDGYDCACRDGYDGDGFTCTYQDDGDLTVSSIVDLSTDALRPWRACADGVSYSVLGLSAQTAELSVAPPACCLEPGNLVLLINLQGTSGAIANVGAHELLRVASVSGTTVYFDTSKTRSYGSGSGTDDDIGIGSDVQKVMLLRVPLYGDVNVEAGAVLSTAAWDGLAGGVLALRASGTLRVDGTVDMSGKGYRGGDRACRQSSQARAQQGESIARVGFPGYAANHGGGGGGCVNVDAVCAKNWENRCVLWTQTRGGAGGGYGDEADRNNTTNNSAGEGCALGCSVTSSPAGVCLENVRGGQGYGDPDLRTGLFLGSGGGGGGGHDDPPGSCNASAGGRGGGAMLIEVGDLLNFGTLAADGAPRGECCRRGGAGSGGSIYFSGADLTLGNSSVTAIGGLGASSVGAGADGRIMLEAGSGTIVGVTLPPAYVP